MMIERIRGLRRGVTGQSRVQNRGRMGRRSITEVLLVENGQLFGP